MRQRFILAALILVLSSIVRVETTEATFLGLAEGTYIITLDFTVDTYDATGTMTIGPNSITAFHVNSNAALGFFDCDGCTVPDLTPDRVNRNGPTDDFFLIHDLAGPGSVTGNELDINVHFGTPNVSAFNDDTGFGAQGTFSVRPVPEPSSLFLFVLGVLGLRARMRRRGN